MSISVFPLLAIAIAFFLVTMAIAVGPLLMCRLLAGPGRDERPAQPRRFSLAGTVLTACCVLIGLGVGAVVLYFTLRASAHRHTPAIVVHQLTPSATDVQFHSGPGMPYIPAPGEPHPAGLSVGPVPIIPFEVAEQSLFVQPQPPAAPRHAVSRSDLLEIGSIGLTYLLLFVVAGAVLSQRFRAFVARATPVVLAVALLGTLFWWTLDRSHQPQYAQTAAVTMVENRPRLEEAAAPAAAPVASTAVATTTTVDAADTRSSGAAETVSAGDSAPVAERGADPPVLAYVGTAAAGMPREALPEWTRQADTHGPIRVIDSGLHATVKLAEEHALTKLKSLLQEEMAHRSPRTAGWQAPDEVVLNSGSILQRAVERTQIQVGENVIPMYEAYWQVDTSSIEPLFRAWQPSVIQHRLIWMGAGVGLLTLLLGSVAGVLKVDEQTQGRRRKSLAIATLTFWGFVAGIALFIA